MQKARTRLVNFRVSEEEFKQLQAACKKHGARCLSEFARTAMLAPTSMPDTIMPIVLDLDRRIATLEVSITEIADLIARSADVTRVRAEIR